jgi:hypothetical protein
VPADEVTHQITTPENGMQKAMEGDDQKMGGGKAIVALVVIFAVLVIVLGPSTMNQLSQINGPNGGSGLGEAQKAPTDGEYRGGTGIVQKASDEARAQEILDEANNSRAIRAPRR